MNPMDRRAFLQQGLAAATAASLAGAGPAAAQVGPEAPSPTTTATTALPTGAGDGITDVHVYLGRSPFREFPWSGTEILARELRARGVRQAWAGSFEALLHRDLAAVNARLAAECAAHSEVLVPVGTVNPVLPDWREDLRRCADVHGMRVLRLHPAYHGYALDDARVPELLDLAAARGLLVQVVTQLEDARTQHPLVQVKPVDLKPLPALLQACPKARVMLLNANATMVTTALRGLQGLWMDFAMIEGVGGVEALLKTWPAEKLCFGSYAPVFYWESARLKLVESGVEGAVLAAALRGNAHAAQLVG